MDRRFLRVATWSPQNDFHVRRQLADLAHHLGEYRFPAKGRETGDPAGHQFKQNHGPDVSGRASSRGLISSRARSTRSSSVISYPPSQGLQQLHGKGQPATSFARLSATWVVAGPTGLRRWRIGQSERGEGRFRDGFFGSERCSGRPVRETLTMARTIQKITLNQAENIPFDKLVLSQKNVRRVKNGVSIEDLAEDIARRGLLQSLNVRIERDADGHETGRYEVPAGGRRFMACERLIAQKRMAGTAPVPCIVNRAESTSAEEDSLAENVQREQFHPLDQFRAFRTLCDQGLDIEEIAARFFVSPATVRQRLKLATVSPKLLDLYGEDKIRLEQVMAMSICDDHARQEQVWERVCGSHMQDPYAIKRLLTETTVRADDRRAVYVGEEAYETCGGIILRDLFEQDGGGWFQDAALLEQLVFEKLNADVEAIRSEGWKWVEAAISFPYGHASGLRRFYGQAREPSAEEVERHEALKAEYDRIDADYAEADDYDEAIEDKLEELGEKIDSLNDRPEVYGADQMAIAGVFVTLAADGRVQVERGFVRPEDEPRTEPGDAERTGRAGPDTAVCGKGGIAGNGAVGIEGSVAVQPTKTGRTRKR